MIILHQPPPVWGLPSMSPFCAKLETYLRMTKLEYKVVAGNPIQAPKGKIPYISIDGKIMGDSGLIIEFLKEKYGDPLDKNLSDIEKAQALALRRMVEEHLYFAGAWFRWSLPESWEYVRKFFLTLLPPIIGPLILKKIKKDFMQNMHGQGMGRHTQEEILSLAKQDLKAISLLLGDKLFFLGDTPTSIDATMYGFLIQMIWVPWQSPIKEYALSLPNISTYCERMKKRYY